MNLCKVFYLNSDTSECRNKSSGREFISLLFKNYNIKLDKIVVCNRKCASLFTKFEVCSQENNPQMTMTTTAMMTKDNSWLQRHTLTKEKWVKIPRPWIGIKLPNIYSAWILGSTSELYLSCQVSKSYGEAQTIWLKRNLISHSKRPRFD